MSVLGDDATHQQRSDDGVVEHVSREEAQDVPVEVVSADTEQRMEFRTADQPGEQGHARIGKRGKESDENENSGWHGPWPMALAENAKQMVA